MKSYIIQRLIHMVPLILLISFLCFFVINLAPGDFLATMALNPQISQDTIEQMRMKFGLDRPWYIQYLRWLWNVLHLDFGYSFSNHVPVFSLIKARFWNTLILAFASAIFAWGVAIPLGIVSAVRQYSWIDKLASFFAFFGLSIPRLFFALLMIFFAAKTGWFPVGGMRSLNYDDLSLLGKFVDILHHLALPAIVLGTTQMAGRMRQMRANLLDCLRADYITTARAKGLPERTVIYKHAVRNAINPLVTLFGFTIASLLGGSFIVEVIMSWPGLGRLTLDALFARDIYLVMGSLMIASFMLIVGNLIADVLLALVDPRISYE